MHQHLCIDCVSWGQSRQSDRQKHKWWIDTAHALTCSRIQHYRPLRNSQAGMTIQVMAAIFYHHQRGEINHLYLHFTRRKFTGSNNTLIQKGAVNYLFILISFHTIPGSALRCVLLYTVLRYIYYVLSTLRRVSACSARSRWPPHCWNVTNRASWPLNFEIVNMNLLLFQCIAVYYETYCIFGTLIVPY